MFGSKNKELASTLQETIEKSLAVSRENGELSEKNRQLTKEIREQEELINELRKEVKSLETDKAVLLDNAKTMGIDLSCLLTGSVDLYKIYGIELIGKFLNEENVKNIIPEFDEAVKNEYALQFMSRIGLSLEDEIGLKQARETYAYCRHFALSFFNKINN